MGPQLAELSDVRRVPLATFNMAFALGLFGDQGLVLGVSTSPSTALEDNVGAVVVAVRSSSNPHNYAFFCCSACGAVCPHCLSQGFPQVYNDQSEEGKKISRSIQMRTRSLTVRSFDTGPPPCVMLSISHTLSSNHRK